MLKEWAKYATLVLLGVALSLFGIEYTVRHLPDKVLPSSLRDLVKAMTFREPGHYVTDPELGFVFPPGTDFQTTNSEYSFRVTTHLNYDHAGFRGGTLGGNAWGVAVGDSFTFGIGVNQEATWEAQLANLSQREIVNLGVQGYGPQQYTRVLEKFGVGLHPKVVFYCLFTNDLRDSEQYDKWRRHPRSNFSMKAYLQNYSVLYNLFHQWRRARTQGSRYVQLSEVGQDLSVRKLRDEIIADGRRMPTAWPMIEHEIDTAVDRSRQAGAILAVLYFPSKEEVYWDLIKRRMPAVEELDDRFDQLKKATLAYCQSRQLTCLDLTPALKRQARLKEKLYFSIDTHWNELGHKTVAAEIYRFLVDQKLL